MPNEPDEMPLQPSNPEIKQPHDPQEPGIPQEDKENIPSELPLENPDQPEADPDKI